MGEGRGRHCSSFLFGPISNYTELWERLNRERDGKKKGHGLIVSPTTESCLLFHGSSKIHQLGERVHRIRQTQRTFPSFSSSIDLHPLAKTLCSLDSLPVCFPQLPNSNFGGNQADGLTPEGTLIRFSTFLLYTCPPPLTDSDCHSD